MKSIVLLSDTHGHMDQQILSIAEKADELWHGGDWGPKSVLESLEVLGKPIRSVWGNIDGTDIRQRFPETDVFTVEGVKVLIRHIGGYPGRYAPGIKQLLQAERPALFISGHSHILKVMPDPAIRAASEAPMLHMNPGACGHHGWHVVRTLLRFSIDNGVVRDCEVVELGKRGR